LAAGLQYDRTATGMAMDVNFTPANKVANREAQVKSVMFYGTHRMGIFGPLKLSETPFGEWAVVVGVVENNELGVLILVQFLEISHVFKEARKANNGELTVVSRGPPSDVGFTGFHEFAAELLLMDLGQVAPVPVFPVGVEREQQAK
jgi:hypothetical protein